MKLNFVIILLVAFHSITGFAGMPCAELMRAEDGNRGVASDTSIGSVRKELAKKNNTSELTNIIAHFWSHLESAKGGDVSDVFNSVPKDSSGTMPAFLTLSQEPAMAKEEAREVAIYLARAIDKKAPSDKVKAFLEDRSKSGGLTSINSYCSKDSNPIGDPIYEGGDARKLLEPRHKNKKN